MKHLLNNLTEEEKNSIREQHKGGMNVVSENFSRLINSKLGDVRTLVSEQSLEFESPKSPTGAVKSGISSTSQIAKSALSHTKNDPSVYNDPKGENSGIVYSVKEVTPGKFRIYVKTVKYPEPTDAATVFLSPRDERFKDYSTKEEAQKVIDSMVPNQTGMNESFLRLLNSKLGDVRTLVSEAAPAPEPVLTDEEDTKVGVIYFNEGQTTFRDPKDYETAVTDVSNWIRPSLPTIQKFHKDSEFKLPKFIKLYVGTSSTGSSDTNSKVAQGRMATLNKICLAAFDKLGVRADVAYKLIVQSYEEYRPSKIDGEFYDTSKVKPKSSERIAFIVIEPIKTEGMTNTQIGYLQGNLIDASSIVNTWLVDNVDEEAIVRGINRLETYSDITDLNKAMKNARMGSLESFLNDQLFDDSSEKQKIANHLNDCAKRSGKSSVAKVTNGTISIMI